MKILDRQTIEQLLSKVDPLPAIEQGFVQYSQGRSVIPPVGELLMEQGEVHIKYGYIRQDDFYVIKVASGFYNNPAAGLSSSDGLMLLFSQNTGQLACALLDQGLLTDVRTAIAGAIAAKYLAPKHVKAIGILGCGIQARLQAQYLADITRCRELVVWARTPEKLKAYQNDMGKLGFNVQVASSPGAVAAKANLIVTTTPSTQALLHKDDIQPGTHITAVGADTAEKTELESGILAKADLVVADSIEQCQSRGEIHQALKQGAINNGQLVELGDIIATGEGRASEWHITVADLTGVAVQDIKIAESLFAAANGKNNNPRAEGANSG